MDPFVINWLAVAIATVASFAVGGVWYSPVLFARPWMALVGKTEEDLRASSNVGLYVVALVTSVIGAVVLSIVADWAGADTIVDGLLLGLFLSVGLVGVGYIVTYAFEGRPRGLALINAGHDVAHLTAMAAIIGAMN